MDFINKLLKRSNDDDENDKPTEPKRHRPMRVISSLPIIKQIFPPPPYCNIHNAATNAIDENLRMMLRQYKEEDDEEDNYNDDDDEYYYNYNAADINFNNNAAADDDDDDDVVTHESDNSSSDNNSCGCNTNASCSHRSAEHYHKRRVATKEELEQLRTIRPKNAGEEKVISALEMNDFSITTSQRLHNIVRRSNLAAEPKNSNAAAVVEELEEDDEDEVEDQMRWLAQNGGGQPLSVHDANESSESSESSKSPGEIKQLGFTNKKWIIFGVFNAGKWIMPGTVDLLELMNTEYSKMSKYDQWNGYNCSYEHSTNGMTDFLVSSISAVAF